MEIKTSTVYSVFSEDFNTLDNVKEHVENKIGFIIDKMQPRLTPKQAMQMHDLITGNKAVLCELLSITYENSDDPLYGDEHNILDL